MKEINVLGTKYTVEFKSVSEDPLFEKCDGYCDWTTKRIVVEREAEGTLGNMVSYIQKVLRHEIVHAFLFESGLAECSKSADSWALNEEMVDWFARQGVKIHAAWREAGAL